MSLGRERLRWEAGEPRKLAQGFLPGDYRVRVTFDDGYVGDASFSVPSTAIEPSSSGPNSVTGPLVVVKASAPR